MLKIKDNIDLKELEKFGFGLWKEKKYGEPDECYKPTYYERTKFILRDYGHTTYQQIRVYVKDRRIRFYVGSGERYNKNWADDLIKADMVEKVEE